MAQTTRVTTKARTPTSGNSESKTCAGAGNRHRAKAIQLQAKLTIGKANDPFEQEADRVASQVMQMSNAREMNLETAAAGNHSLQRQCACGGACDKCKKKRLSLKRRTAHSHESGGIPSSVHDVLSSSGRPLDAATRAFMEPRFGYDFSPVRVHTDAAAARSARDVNAFAFTVGNHIAFAAGQYVAGSARSNRLLAHELAHVVQQGSAGSLESEGHHAQSHEATQSSGVVQRAGNPLFIPFGFPCDPDFTTGRPPGTDLLFPTGSSKVDATHNRQLTDFVDSWVSSGGTDDILIHGYASLPGDETSNWILSCERAEHVRDELISRGIPAIHIDIVAHGESVDFGASDSANQHAVISTSPAGIFSNPILFTVLTPDDNFAGRSGSRFGVGETIKLSFFSIPPRPARDFGGLVWELASGGGTLTGVTDLGRAIYIAPPTADTVQLDLRISSGVNAGRVVRSRTISIVEPSGVHMVAIAGTAPDDSGKIGPGVWGAGFSADVFIEPIDVSFKGVEFGEGRTNPIITPRDSFLKAAAGRTHLENTFGPAGPGNATTGTALTVPDNPSGVVAGAAGTLFGRPRCGPSEFLWAIPWEFSVAGGARTPFARNFRARHHMTSSLFCRATIDKAGAGPFCRRIDGTAC